MSVTALFLVPALIWGSTWYAITWQLGVVAPEVSVTYRFAAASLLLAARLRRDAAGRSRFSLRDHAFLAGVGLLMICINYNFIYWAERIVVSGLVAVVYLDDRVHDADRHAHRVRRADAPAAARRRRARRDRRRAPVPAGARRGRTRRRQRDLGVALVLAATLACALGNLIAVRNHKAGIPTIQGTAWMMIYGTLFAAAVARVAAARRGPSTRGRSYVLSLAYLAVCGSVVAFVAYFALLKRVGAGPSSYITVATPVIASCCRRCSRATGGRRSPRSGGARRARQRACAPRGRRRKVDVDRARQSSPSFLITSTLSMRRVLPSVAAASTMSRFG